MPAASSAIRSNSRRIAGISEVRRCSMSSRSKFWVSRRSSGASRWASSMRRGVVTEGLANAARSTSSWSSASSCASSCRHESRSGSLASWKIPCAYRRAILLRGTGLLLHLLDGGFDQLAMPFTVQAFADDPAHRLGDEIGHLQANGVDRPLAFGVDIAAGCLDDPPRLLTGFLLRLLLNPFGGSVGSFDDSSRLLTRLLDRGRSLIQALLGLLPCLLILIQLRFDLLLPRFGGSNNRRVDPPREHPQHQQEGDDLGDQGAIDVEQPCLEIDDR